MVCGWYDNSLIIIAGFSTQKCIERTSVTLKNKRFREEVDDISNTKKLRYEAVDSHEVQMFLKRGTKRKKDTEFAPVDEMATNATHTKSQTFDNSSSDLVIETKKQMVYVTFFQVPDELISKLKLHDLKSCNFYISKSENQREIKVVDGRPSDDDIAFTDLDGNHRPFETGLIDL